MTTLHMIEEITGIRSQEDNIRKLISKMSIHDYTRDALNVMQYFSRQFSKEKMSVHWYAFIRYTMRFNNIESCRKNGDMFTLTFKKKTSPKENMQTVMKIFSRYGWMTHNFRIGKKSATFYLISKPDEVTKSVGNVFQT